MFFVIIAGCYKLGIRAANREDRGDCGGRGSGGGVSGGLLAVCKESNEEERWWAVLSWQPNTFEFFFCESDMLL